MIKRIFISVCFLSFYSSSWAEDIYKYDIIGEKILLAFNCSHMADIHSLAKYPRIPKEEAARLRNYGYKLGIDFLEEADPLWEYEYTSVTVTSLLTKKDMSNDFKLGELYGGQSYFMYTIFDKLGITRDFAKFNNEYNWYKDENCRLLGR